MIQVIAIIVAGCFFSFVIDRLNHKRLKKLANNGVYFGDIAITDSDDRYLVEFQWDQDPHALEDGDIAFFQVKKSA